MSFVHKTNPLDQAKAPKSRIYRKKEKGYVLVVPQSKKKKEQVAIIPDSSLLSAMAKELSSVKNTKDDRSDFCQIYRGSLPKNV